MVSLQAGFFCIIFNFRCFRKGFWSYKVYERCTQQQNQPASDGYAFFKCTPRDSRARTIGWQIWIKHSHKGIIRRSLQRFILASIIIINKRVSEGCIFKCTIDSRPTDTSLLRTPYHCRQEASPGETHKEMTEIYSRYYGLSLLRKWGHFHNPRHDISLVFSLARADTSSKTLTHML